MYIVFMSQLIVVSYTATIISVIDDSGIEEDEHLQTHMDTECASVKDTMKF